MPDFDWTNTCAEAAQLVADGELSQDEIAAKLDVSRQTLYRWRQDPAFAARVDTLVEDMKAALRRMAITHRERRTARLNRDWFKLQRIVEERAEHAAFHGVPGGSTGLLKHNVKRVKEGEDVEVYDVYALDGDVLKEIREIEKQAAQELGQWVDRQMVEDARKSYESANTPEGL